MPKVVPDPPPTCTLQRTASATFGSCEGSHDPLFSVRPGINAEDALIHLYILLRSAYATNAKACEVVDNQTLSVLWSTRTSIEMALGLVEALLDGIEVQHSHSLQSG